MHATEVSNASRTLLYNIHELAWDEVLLRELGIHWSSFHNNQALDGRFLDLEVPIFLGGLGTQIVGLPFKRRLKRWTPDMGLDDY